MKNFNYHQPTLILFGRGRVKEIGERVAFCGKRCLLVTMPVFPAIAPLYIKVKNSLLQAGVQVAHFDQVIPNPTTDIVSLGSDIAKDFHAEVILGLGGGSSLDTAKAIAVEATHNGTCWDYLFFRERQPSEKTLPIITVTTTSGTGSHITQVAVVTNPEEKSKSALFNSYLFPKVSIVDPELMLTVPSYITATTGFDVFAHAFESFINPNGSPYTDIMALESIRLVARYLPIAVKDGSSLEARTWLAWADTLAGLCIANAGVTLPHGIAMAMSGFYPHISHGEALASIYPAVLRYTYNFAVDKFAQVAEIFDKSLNELPKTEKAKKFCDLLVAFLNEISLKISLENLNIPENELKVLAQASLILPDYKNHPKVASANEILELLERSYRS